MFLLSAYSHTLTPLKLNTARISNVLAAALDAIVPFPRPRSQRWLSAVYATESKDPDSEMCSAGYQVRRCMLHDVLDCKHLREPITKWRRVLALPYVPLPCQVSTFVVIPFAFSNVPGNIDAHCYRCMHTGTW